ncbi:MAG TPA: hypothetical protein VEQ63_03790 [Bryobacteraceae bacterium]|nr:hypothetical protein [Bryobacteraceae bacterium]
MDRMSRVLGTQSRWIVGVDLGQRQDYSAVAALEVHEAAYDERDPITADFRRELRYRVRLAERVQLETPYTELVRRLRAMTADAALAGKCTLVVDATGVGAPVLELLRAAGPRCRIVPVMITGGDQEGSDGTVYRVPKQDLMLGMQVLLEQRKLDIAKRAGFSRELVSELGEMRATPTGFGRQRFGPASSAKHDDLVMALSLACWWVRKTGPRSWVR